MGKVSKRKQNLAERIDSMNKWLVFLGLCRFFNFKQDFIYRMLSTQVDLTAWYPDLVRFKYTLSNNPVALINKESVGEVIEHFTTLLKDDVFTVMADHTKMDAMQDKWESFIDG